MYLPGWARPPFAADGRFSRTAANPLQTAVDRAFGALADSLGLTTTRAVLDNMRGLIEAEIERQLAMADYLSVVVSAMGDAARLSVTRLEDASRHGETIDSLLALLRTGMRALDQAMHTAMQSSDGLAATTRLVRAATERQLRIEALIGLAADAAGLPKRGDLDEAYREIQQLKRDLRRLRRGHHQVAAGEPAKPHTNDSGPGVTGDRGQA